MLVVVDTSGTSPLVALDEDGTNTVSVLVRGVSDRVAVEAVLADAGAGVVPSHHAELSVDWLLQRAGLNTSTSNPVEIRDLAPWLRMERVDGSGRWLAAPVIWSR
jgi:hypothetical protein